MKAKQMLDIFKGGIEIMPPRCEIRKKYLAKKKLLEDLDELVKALKRDNLLRS